MQVSWIGLGAIGANMVIRALGAGHCIGVYARGQGLDEVQARGAQIVPEYRALAENADLLALCLFNDDQVRTVLFDEGVLAGLRPGSCLAIHTTGSPDLAREIGARAPDGVSVLDATFSGGPATVLAGELTMMVGGDRDAVDYARPLFSSYAQTIVHLGPLGAGQSVKLLNNLLFATNLRNAAEILRIADAMGYEAKEVATIIQSCSGASSAMRSFLSGGAVSDVLARLQPYVGKDVATVVKSASAENIDISAFNETAAYFKRP